MDQSDLCHKRQVEPKDGKIRRYTGTGTNTEYVDVSSHLARYLYCEEHPDDIYCEVDPKRDAFDDPEIAFNCGDHYCTVDDCEENWKQASADESCYEERFSISKPVGTTQTCTVNTLCEDSKGAWGRVIFFGDVSYFDNLSNCNGQLSADEC